MQALPCETSLDNVDVSPGCTSAYAYGRAFISQRAVLAAAVGSWAHGDGIDWFAKLDRP